MKPTNFTLILFTFIIILCGSTSGVNHEEDKTNIQWGMPWLYHELSDSLSLHAQGVKADYDCFPSAEMLNSDSKIYTAIIFNKWGEEVYNSDDSTQSWICNCENNLNKHNEGVYVFYIIIQSMEVALKADTIQGQLILYKTNRNG